MATKRITTGEKKTTAPKRVRSSKTAETTAEIVPFPQVDVGQIAHRAYELFAQRGYQHGHDLEDWLTAERELTAR